MAGNAELLRQLGSIEDLLRNIEASADPGLHANVRELVELVMNLHGAGLERVLELAQATGEPGEMVIRKLATDELVSSLLVLHGLHPLDLESRVRQALDKVGARLRPHGGEVELLTIQDGAVRLRLQATGHGCGSTAQALKEMVEEAVYQAAPDLTALTIEGDEQKQSFVPLDMLLNYHPVAAGNGAL